MRFLRQGRLDIAFRVRIDRHIQRNNSRRLEKLESDSSILINDYRSLRRNALTLTACLQGCLVRKLDFPYIC